MIYAGCLETLAYPKFHMVLKEVCELDCLIILIVKDNCKLMCEFFELKFHAYTDQRRNRFSNTGHKLVKDGLSALAHLDSDFLVECLHVDGRVAILDYQRLR